MCPKERLWALSPIMGEIVGKQIFSEPKTMRTLKSGTVPPGPFWQSHWAEWSEHCVDPKPSERQRMGAQLLSPDAAQALEKAAAAAFPSEHPSWHFPFFWACPWPHSTLPHPLWLGRLLSTWTLWRMVGFGHFSSSRSSEIPEASTTRARKYWNESDKSTRI